MFEKLKVGALVIAATALFAITPAKAVSVIDPNSGLSGSVTIDPSMIGAAFFDPVDFINGDAGHTATINVATASLIDFQIQDMGQLGDAFALQLDGFTLAPTSGNTGANTRGPGATSHFNGIWNNIFLSAGSHTFGIFHTAGCCNVATLNSFEFSAARVVPLPAALPFLAGGIGFLGLMGWRRKRTAA
ncbi:hypothetical protein IWQ55_004779 [Labrenzia sp. EL_208]|nr:hypothetical protein [Labrenzia sp. EL_132]MBG6231550.1 hypothetical protein [Labrenzia sp. EL_208]